MCYLCPRRKEAPFARQQFGSGDRVFKDSKQSSDALNLQVFWSVLLFEVYADVAHSRPVYEKALSCFFLFPRLS